MKIDEIKTPKDPLFAEAMRLYETSFPSLERREYSDHLTALDTDAFHMCVLTDEDLVGILFYWEWRDTVYLEHLAIADNMRCRGYGSLALSALKAKGKTVVLEIEPPENGDCQARRKSFYERNGFIYSGVDHLQVHYRAGDADCMLRLMSYPHALADTDVVEFDKLLKEITRNESDGDIEVRKLTEHDDLLRAAELIYYTDPYIYPYLFDDFFEAREILRDMMFCDTVYACKNMTAAFCGGKIVGLAIAVKTPITVDKADYAAAFRGRGEKINERFEKIFADYFALMADEPSGVYVANVCVAEGYRGRGIARKLLAEILDDKTTYMLECVKANTVAWKLYRELGFEIDCEYAGVFGVPCYRMTKRPKK